MVSYDDFSQLDIRIGTITSAAPLEGADRLLRLTVDLGEGEDRQIIAGIAPYVLEPTGLVGYQIPIIANLEPRRIKGYESQGMLLAASGDEGSFALLHPSVPLPPGSSVK